MNEIWIKINTLFLLNLFVKCSVTFTAFTAVINWYLQIKCRKLWCVYMHFSVAPTQVYSFGKCKCVWKIPNYLQRVKHVTETADCAGQIPNISLTESTSSLKGWSLRSSCLVGVKNQQSTVSGSLCGRFLRPGLQHHEVMLSGRLRPA